MRQAPQRVKALALLASSARPDTPELIRLRSDAIELFEQGRMREVLQANLAFAFDPAHAAALAPRYLAMIERAGAAQLIAQNRAVMARADPRPLLPQIACPTLVVCGESDLLTPPEHAQRNGGADSRRAAGTAAAMWAPAHLGAAAARERATDRLARGPLSGCGSRPRARRCWMTPPPRQTSPS